MKRVEKKYIISYAQSNILLSKLRVILRGDPHNGREGYLVRSLYFDTANRSDYFDKIEGIDPRRKIRLRAYPPHTRYANLEIKERQGEYQTKDSVRLEYSEFMPVAEGRYGTLLDKGDGISSRLYGIMRAEGYMPECVVQYRRIAFISNHGDLRITIDRDLCAGKGRYAFPDSECGLYPVMHPGKLILEVKYDRILPEYVRDIIQGCGCMPESCSKYCMALSAAVLNTF